MDFKWILSLLVVSCCFSASCANKSRLFIVTGNTNSDDNARVYDFLKSQLTTVFFPIIYIIVFALGLPANGMAVWVFLFRTKKKHPSSIYMANLALADLLFVIWIPLKISYHLNGNNWTYGEPLCKILTSFFYGNMYSSILFITCLSVQRYWVVAHPLSTQRKNNKIAIGVTVAIWVFICLTSTPLYLYDHTAKIKDPNVTTCHDVSFVEDSTELLTSQSVRLPLVYFIFMATTVFFIPCIVIVVAYIRLLKVLGSGMKDSVQGNNRHKAVMLIVIVLVTFLVCFLPSNIMLVVHYAQLTHTVANRSYAFYVSTLCLASVNSILDPFIYYFVSEDFRDHVTNTLLCRSSRTVERMRVSFSSMKYSKKSKAFEADSRNTESSTI
ncbi:proteinase-activated receptor 2 [Kryptolebias marmoratus]|uniref:Coagulation factor II (thrombin) receptor-like 1, tandem duplicate 2 n=1 Tax=Kryptolebias marmoratus TaxID=37003 RepID=A0A3Q3AJG7_KRYMA|nr:proteinase-activated receptor 2 [Kryptolebias marmoratus]